jgi:hypothetical protein
VSRARFDKRCTVAPARAIERAVRHLLAQGYALELQTEEGASLVYSEGSRLSARLDSQRHKLDIHADGKKLHFDFHVGLGDSGYLTKAERKVLDKRATDTAEATKDPPPPPPLVDTGDQFHCRYCSALTPSSQPKCRHCGGENFS